MTDPIKGFRENYRIIDRVLGMQGMKKISRYKVEEGNGDNGVVSLCK